MRGVWALAVALGLAWGQGGDYAARCARLYAQGALEAAQAGGVTGATVRFGDVAIYHALLGALPLSPRLRRSASPHAPAPADRPSSAVSIAENTLTPSATCSR